MYLHDPVKHTILFTLSAYKEYMSTTHLFRILRHRGFATSRNEEFIGALEGLKREGMIERNEAHKRSNWYRLTAKGQAQIK